MSLYCAAADPRATRAGAAREALAFAERLVAAFPEDERDRAWLDIAEAWAGLDPEKGLSYFQKVKDTRTIESSAIILCRCYALKLMTERGVAGALKSINELKFGSLRHLSWVAVGEVWARTNTEKAAAWARTLPRQLDREWTLLYISKGAAQASADTASAIAKEITDPDLSRAAHRYIFMLSAQKEPAAAWAKMFDGEGEHQQALAAESIARSWGAG
ncbi:MAG TPA: hypothetical protein VEJ63_15105 [Planctomycetota bacterium]|nr:hypothetical protein [Planctomycetota bacterium]